MGNYLTRNKRCHCRTDRVTTQFDSFHAHTIIVMMAWGGGGVEQSFPPAVCRSVTQNCELNRRTIHLRRLEQHADKLNWPTRRKAKPPRTRDSIYPVGRATVFPKHTDKPSRLIRCKAKLPSPNDNTSIDRATVPSRQVNIPGRLVQLDASLNIFWNKYSQDRETVPMRARVFHIFCL